MSENAVIVGIAANDYVITNRNLKQAKNMTIHDMLMSYYVDWDILRYENIEICQLAGKDKDCLKLTFDNGKTITVSPECRVYTKNREYVAAKDLSPDDYVVFYYPTPYNNLEMGKTKETFLVKREETKSDIYEIIGTVNNDMFVNGILVQCKEVAVRYPIIKENEQ